MNSFPPHMARLMVTQRLEEAERRQRRRIARRPAPATKVPQQRRRTGLLARMFPRTGVRVPTT